MSGFCGKVLCEVEEVGLGDWGIGGLGLISWDDVID